VADSQNHRVQKLVRKSSGRRTAASRKTPDNAPTAPAPVLAPGSDAAGVALPARMAARLRRWSGSSGACSHA
jgi:hypothetical protein